MILIAAVGNTNITLSFYEKELRYQYKINVNRIADLSKLVTGYNYSKIVYATVVPSKTQTIVDCMRKNDDSIEVIEISKNSIFGYEILYDKHQIGIDRLLGIEGVLSVCSVPFILADLGTATTINVVDGHKKFIGGLILPGVYTGLKALTEHTELLTPIKLRMPKNILGRTTEENLNNGAIFGHATLLNGLFQKIIETYKLNDAKIVLTGGHSRLFLQYLDKEVILDEHLLLKGLVHIYEESSKY